MASPAANAIVLEFMAALGDSDVVLRDFEHGPGWSILPGAYTPQSFTAGVEPLPLSGTQFANITAASFTSTLGPRVCFTNGSNGYRNTTVHALGAPATGCFEGGLGSWFTTFNALVCVDATGASAALGPYTGHSAFARPFEYNGTLFVSSLLANGMEVLAAVPPAMPFPNTTFGGNDTLQRRIQHVSTESAGTGLTVGLFSGAPVLMSTKGVWAIEAASDGQSYKLGKQAINWNGIAGESYAAFGAVVLRLTAGGVYAYTADSVKHRGGTGFAHLAGTSRALGCADNLRGFAATLVGDRDFAIFDGFTGYGAMVQRNATGTWHSLELGASPDPVRLRSAWIELPRALALESLSTSRAVRSVAFETDRGHRWLMRSQANAQVWRINATARRFRFEIEVTAGSEITAPTVTFAKGARI